MSVRRDVLEFLRRTGAFARSADQASSAMHVAALDGIVAPAIARAGDYPLRPAQVAAFEGLARLRSGLVLGPPGTGKTHLLSWVVLGHVWARAAVGLPSRVLLTAFTRSAIETLLEGVATRASSGPGEASLAYLGTPRSPLHPNVRGIPSAYAAADDLKDALAQPNVIFASTIWGLNSTIRAGCLPLSDGPTAPFFDLVAVDEASQMVLGQGLMALAGMSGACRVVVAGDDRQLPPIRSARGMTMDGREIGGSLYAFLKGVGVPEFPLDETFRLNAPLTVFPERRFYPGIYTSAVPDRRLALSPDWREGLDELERLVLDPALPTVVLVHDGPSAATRSPFEVELAVRLGMRFRSRMRTPSGQPFETKAFWREGMALVSPHRAQNAALRLRLAAPERSDAFVDTVDRIQGRERDVVIMSYTVSDAEFALAEAEFIFSPERLNVAITRARSKLVVIVGRRLLDVIPPQQEVLDKAEVLREFVFAAEAVSEHIIQLPGLPPTRILVRAQGFGQEGRGSALPAPDPAPSVESVELDARLQAVLDMLRIHCEGTGKDDVTLPRLQKLTSNKEGLPGAYADARALHDAGWVTMSRWLDQYRPGEHYWRVRPLTHRRSVARLDDPSVRDRIMREVYGDKVPYHHVQQSFAWMSSSHPGEDLLWPIVSDLVESGRLRRSTNQHGMLFLSPMWDEAEGVLDEPTLPELHASDFQVLNALEDLEVDRIDVGLVELWSDSADIVRRGYAQAEASASLSRLAAHGHVLLAADGRVRSRMAELAREVRYVKQRFRPDDADRRPYLVRSLKVLVRDRTKPRQDKPLAGVVARVKEAHHDPAVHQAMDGLGAALEAMWGGRASLAGFQERSFEAILSSWLNPADRDAFVVAADTGSGKTEAAVLPLVAGASVDAIRGVVGTRVVMAYPRVRLAANQSQRLARYLSALSRQGGMPALTLGVQFADVPSSWRMGAREAEEREKAGWVRAGGVWRFPLFACPAPSCASPIDLYPGGGIDGADALRCPRCSWTFRGWIGTKEDLRLRPPTFFLPTMDSLHQWMQTPQYGKLFGDGAVSAPRAFMADEIHLYAYVHGAQVGYAMRRFLARSEANDPERRKCLAIGMSATLGDPAAAFGRLIGREDVGLIEPEADETPVNPRGREYFYFIQPEVESRERDVAGASTTIQALMCLAHGMRRRRGAGGGFRALAFLDSIDKVRRVHSAYDDAECGNGLAALRTSRFGDDALTGRPRNSCCGEPATCERFVDGECWYFAVNDRRQVRADGKRWRPGRPLTVARSPVSSGTEGVIEKMIKDSDVVFATSSLEVGYDDPDISLVYQHYGPQNLASFIQRKGRGGRGADDRPVTAVTLSIYKPRDTYWFSRPGAMLDAKGFEAPLNPENHFVRRAQILCLLLDGLAAHEARSGLSPWLGDGDIEPLAIEGATASIERMFGPQPWTAYGFDGLAELWAAARADGGMPRIGTAADARTLPWIPRFLHDTMDLPSLDVMLPPGDRRIETDIQLAFATLAPGNVTRRFDRLAGAWRPPKAGRAAWLADADYAEAERFEPCGPDPAELLSELPSHVRFTLGSDLDASVVRPRRITLEVAGTFLGQSAAWKPAFRLDARGLPVAVDDAADKATLVDHESVGGLLGCAIVRTRDGAGRPCPEASEASGFEAVVAFTTDARDQGSGLTVTHVAWGGDAALRTMAPGSDPVAVTQTFVDPTTGRLALHGYRVETEGIQVLMDRSRMERFIRRELERPEPGMAGWHRLHMTRAETVRRLEIAGVGRYDAERIAALVGGMVSNPVFRERVARQGQFPNVPAICGMFEEVRRDHQAFDPLLTEARVRNAAEVVTANRLGPALRDVFRSLDDEAAWDRYIRSCLLNGVAIRLRQLLVLAAQGDERRVGAHCKLPVFYDDPVPLITIAEAGQGGDGTTRAFLKRGAETWRRWSAGFAASCPNADEDAVLERFFSARHRHAEWLSINPRDQGALERLSVALRGGDPTAWSVPPSVTRILFGHQAVGPTQFRTYDLAVAIHDARCSLESHLGRPSLPWEIASAATAQAASGEGAAVLMELLRAYGAVPDADGEGSRSAASRFAEQVYRLGTRLCTDGCRACVHQEGGVLQGMQGESTVSRSMLGRYFACD